MMQTKSQYFSYQTQTNPEQFWTRRLQSLAVGTKPLQHSWSESDRDISRVLNNIAAAAHACNIIKTQWVQQCFASSEDGLRFLDSLHDSKRHINSYWYYALLDIAGVDEEQASDAKLLAIRLFEQAVSTKQLRGLVD